MSGIPTILLLTADSQKHAVNPVDPAPQTHSSIATTKGSTFHTSSQNSTWIIDSGAMDHMTFDHGQLISRKSSTPSVVSNANGTPSPVVGEGSISLSTSLHLNSDIFIGKTIGCGTRRAKLYYLDWAPDSEIKVGQAFTTSGTRSEGGERQNLVMA
ncbi:unnamed protein product [Prunus armeniaca]